MLRQAIYLALFTSCVATPLCAQGSTIGVDGLPAPNWTSDSVEQFYQFPVGRREDVDENYGVTGGLIGAVVGFVAGVGLIYGYDKSAGGDPSIGEYIGSGAIGATTLAPIGFLIGGRFPRHHPNGEGANASTAEAMLGVGFAIESPRVALLVITF